MPFQAGNKLGVGGNHGGGRPPTLKTQYKRFLEVYPNAFEELMEVLFLSGRKGHSVDAQYVCDRLEGRPHQSTDLRVKIKAEASADELRLALEEAQRQSIELLDSVKVPQLTELSGAPESGIIGAEVEDV